MVVLRFALLQTPITAKGISSTKSAFHRPNCLLNLRLQT